jgi:hypothetical protein
MSTVIPAQAGTHAELALPRPGIKIQQLNRPMDPGVRRDDGFLMTSDSKWLAAMPAKDRGAE